MSAPAFDPRVKALDVKSTQKSGLPRWASVILSFVFVFVAVGMAAALVKTKPKPKKEAEAAVAPAVEIVSVAVGDKPVKLRLQGEVTAAQSLVLMPEVGGRVVWQDAQLVAGGFVSAGQPLVRIDPRDYSLAVQQQQAAVSSQSLQLQVEQGRRTIAEREWQLFKGVPPGGVASAAPSGSALALREPHLKSAEVALESARSGLAKAQLQLTRTVITAPFNGFIQSENVEVGQLVSPQSQLATLVGTDSFWVRVSIPVDQLGFVTLPRGEQAGSSVTVWTDTGKGRIVRRGRVIRLLGDLEPSGRMARIIVELDDPFGRTHSAGDSSPQPTSGGETDGMRGPAESDLPLLLGSFVHAEVDGDTLSGVAELPRRAMQSEGLVYVLGEDERLVVRKVEVIYGGEEKVLVRGELKEGDRAIVTPLAVPVVGMQLRLADRPPTPAPSAGAPAPSFKEAP